MKVKSNNTNKTRKKNRINLYKPRKKKSSEDDAAIQYLQAQYEKVFLFLRYYFY